MCICIKLKYMYILLCQKYTYKLILSTLFKIKKSKAKKVNNAIVGVHQLDSRV